MIDITYNNFETELIGASLQTPVLLDIWAPWCGPCKQLGPVLEKLEQDYAGRFILAKLNADEVPDIAGQLSQMFGVRSIPFCVMFVQGQAVDGFVGAIPQDQIQVFLDKHVSPPDAPEVSDTDVNNNDASFAADPIHSLMDALAKMPNDLETRLALMRAQIALGDELSAQTTLSPIKEQATGLLANQRIAAHALYLEALSASQQARSIHALEASVNTNKRDFAARFELAQVHFGAGRFTQAMDDLLEIIMRDRTWQNELARKTYVAILEVMTPPPVKSAPKTTNQDKEKPALALAGTERVAAADPVIDQYRRKLSMALF